MCICERLALDGRAGGKAFCGANGNRIVGDVVGDPSVMDARSQLF
jgi:hypothetical protein